MITMARYLMQNDEKTNEREAERLSRQMELAMIGDEEARKEVSDAAEVKTILEDDGIILALMLNRLGGFQRIKTRVIRAENPQRLVCL